MEKSIRGQIKGIIWLDEFAFVPIKRRSSLRYKTNSSILNLKLLELNNKTRIRNFVRHLYDGK